MPTPKIAVKVLPQGLGRAVRVDRQQQHALDRPLRRDVRMVDPGIGHDKAEPMLDDQQTRAMANHPLRSRTAPPRQSAGPCRPRRRARSRAPTAARSRHRHSALRPWRRSSAPRPAHRRPLGRGHCPRNAATAIAPRSSPGSTSLMPGSAVRVTSRAITRAWRAAAAAPVRRRASETGTGRGQGRETRGG